MTENRKQITENRGQSEKKSTLFVIALIVSGAIAVAAALFLIRDRLVVSAISRYADLEMTYSGIGRTSEGRIVIRDLILVRPRMNLEVSSKRAFLKPSLDKNRAGIFLELEEARFKKAQGASVKSYDTLMRLISIPFDSSWNYSKISGEVVIEPHLISIKEMTASSKDIKFYIKNAVFSAQDNTLDADIKISFSENAVSQFPEDLSKAVLQKEADGWQGLSVNLKGDWAAPAIQITGRLFRLNIRNK